MNFLLGIHSLNVALIQKKITLIRDKRFERNKNFCFIDFNSFQEATNALFYLNSKKIPKTNIFFKLNIAKNNEKFKIYM